LWRARVWKGQVGASPFQAREAWRFPAKPCRSAKPGPSWGFSFSDSEYAPAGLPSNMQAKAKPLGFRAGPFGFLDARGSRSRPVFEAPNVVAGSRRATQIRIRPGSAICLTCGEDRGGWHRSCVTNHRGLPHAIRPRRAAVFGLGTTELLIILAVLILLFGGRQIPRLARSVGESFRAFKEGRREATSALTPPTQEDDLP
jgi:sec-independent protein translocase protein TatA